MHDYEDPENNMPLTKKPKSIIWTEQRGDGVKLFYSEGNKNAILLAIGSKYGISKLIKKGSGYKRQGVSESPLIYWDIVLNTKGKKVLEELTL